MTQIAGAPRLPHAIVAAACVGIGFANAARASPLVVVAAVVVVAATACAVDITWIAVAAATVAVVGWSWGTLRLDALDRSVLVEEVGRADRAIVTVTAPPRRGRFDTRAFARLERYGRRRVSEAVLLELPRGRAPPQGARLSVLARVQLPEREVGGFDQRTWLRRRGVHVVLAVDDWRQVGRRRGLLGGVDRLRGALARSVAVGLHGERRALLTGILLGADEEISDELRDRFRAAGLYHLLAVSGQNVALVAGGVLIVGWLLGVPRLVGQVVALVAIAAYVLAVGAQPSVVRAGIAGALGSLAWLTARSADRWYFLLLGAFALLLWNPYVVFDPGFQLSFAAVAAIFTIAPRLRSTLDGYPIRRGLADVVAISAACGLATAPISWFQFGAVQVLAIPANALAAPVVAPLLGLALATVAVAPVSLDAAAALAWANGWCAAYLAACARVIGGLPFAQVTSGRGAAVLAVGAVLAAAYAWRRWRRT